MFNKYFNGKEHKLFQHTFDEIYNELPRVSKKVTMNEKVLLKSYLQSVDDSKFVDTIIDLFDKNTTFETIRNISNSSGFEVDFNIIKAFDVLKGVYDSLGNENMYANIKAYLFMLLFEPLEYVRSLIKNTKKTHLLDLKDTANVLLNMNKLKLYAGKTPCALSMICANSTEAVHELFTPEFSNAVYELPDGEDDELIDNMIKSVYLIHSKQSEQPKQGGEFDTLNNNGIEDAVNVLSMVSNVFSEIKSINQNGKTMEDNRTMNIINKNIRSEPYNDNLKYTEIIRQYLGDYDKITAQNTARIDNNGMNVIRKLLILNKAKFDSLTPDNKQKVASFVVKYKNVFNHVCDKSVNALFHNLSTASVIPNVGSMTSPEGMIKSAFNQSVNSFKNNANRMRTANIISKLEWISNEFIPQLKSISSIPADTFKEISSSLKRSYRGMNMMVNLNNFNKPKLSLSGGLTKTQTAPKSIPKPQAAQPALKPKTIEPAPAQAAPRATPAPSQPVRPVVINYMSARNEVLQGGESKVSNTAQYIESILAEQKNFNKSFEGVYRDLIKSITTIATSSIKGQNTKLFECVYSLRSIEIDNAKTSVYISGLYQSKNWNKQYILACKTVVQNLEANGAGLFDNVIPVIRRMITLCEETGKKAIEYVTSYMVSTKETSEIIGTISKVVKIPCRLSKEELNMYPENLKKLLSSFTSASNETAAYSLKQQMSKFIDNVHERSDLIKEYFRNKEEQAKIGGNFMFNRDRMGMISQLNNQLKECLLYINDVLDVKLAKYREGVADKVKFDSKTFEKFEKAMIQFKDISNNQDLNRTIKKLKEAIYDSEDKNKYERRMFDLLKTLQKFWKQSGYIDFIVQLYTEFNIFDDGFNWSQFRDIMSLLLSLVNINVATEYKCTLRGGVADVFKNGNEVEIGTISISDIRSITAVAERITQVLKHGNVCKNGAGPISADNITESEGVLNQVIQTTIQQMLSYSTGSNEIEGETVKLHQTGDYTIKIEFTDKHFKFDLTSTAENENSGELRLADMIFEAMLVNVLDVINKYTEIKYTGNFNLPLQISTLIKGGNANLSVMDSEGKTHGGNIFDVLSTNDNNYDEVITDAVPFYIAAFNILLFYYSKYGNNTKSMDPNAPTLHFNITKLSPLYPIANKLESYSIDNTSSLNMQLIKCGVGVFNVYWNKAIGDSAPAKLSNAIDMIFNEINACMVYTTELQYESLRITGKLSNNFMSSLNTNIKQLTESLSQAMSESIINMSMNNEQQAIIFEQILSKAYGKVKAAPQAEKLNALMQVLTSTNTENDTASNVYKFIDLAMMPLFTTCMSYNNIFSLFSIAQSGFDNKEDSYNLKHIKIKVPVDINDTYKDMSAWEAIEFVRNNYRSSDEQAQINAVVVKNLLEGSTIADEYNAFVLSNAVYDVIYNNVEYSTPSGLWYPVFVDSYPKTPIINSKVVGGAKITDEIKLMIYQIYPYASGNTLYDYFTTALSEFASDVDHCIHLMLSYPGIHDKFIKSVSSTIHKFIDNKESFMSRFNITEDQKHGMEAIRMNEKLTYIKPPPYKNGYFIPQYTQDARAVLPSASVYTSGEFIPNSNIERFSFLPIDGYNQNIVVNTQKQSGIVSNYSWTDWVVQKLADCDAAFSCLPYKLVQILQQQSTISRKLQTLVYETSKDVNSPTPQSYSFSSTGLINNPITSNIITRSLSMANQEKTRDNGHMNKQWISNLVGILPYMINKLKTYSNHINYDASYEGINTKTELGILYTCLITFYNDLISSTPKIGYMENTIMFENTSNYHAIAELVPYIVKYNIENIGSSDFSKFEWANKYFFSSIADLIFPEHQGFDRFGKIKKFASDVFSSAVFANEFDSVIPILAKNIWSSGIIISNMKSINSTPDRDFYKYMMLAINMSSELAPNIAERFVRNAASILRNDFETKQGRTGNMILDGNRPVSASTYVSNPLQTLRNLFDSFLPLSRAQHPEEPIILNEEIAKLLTSLGALSDDIRGVRSFGGAPPRTQRFDDTIKDIGAQKAAIEAFNNYVEKNGTKINGTFEDNKFSDPIIDEVMTLSPDRLTAHITGVNAAVAAEYFDNDVTFPAGYNATNGGINTHEALFITKLDGDLGNNILNGDNTVSNTLVTGKETADLQIQCRNRVIHAAAYQRHGVDPTKNNMVENSTVGAEMIAQKNNFLARLPHSNDVRRDAMRALFRTVDLNDYRAALIPVITNIYGMGIDMVLGEARTHMADEITNARGVYNANEAADNVYMFLIAYALYEATRPNHEVWLGNLRNDFTRILTETHLKLNAIEASTGNAKPAISADLAAIDGGNNGAVPRGFLTQVINELKRDAGLLDGGDFDADIQLMLNTMASYSLYYLLNKNIIAIIEDQKIPDHAPNGIFDDGDFHANNNFDIHLIRSAVISYPVSSLSNKMTDIDGMYAVYVLLYLYCYLFPSYMVSYNAHNPDAKLEPIIRIKDTIKFNEKEYYIFEHNGALDIKAHKLDQYTENDYRYFVFKLSIDNEKPASSALAKFNKVLLRSLYVISDANRRKEASDMYGNLFNMDVADIKKILDEVGQHIDGNKYSIFTALTYNAANVGFGGESKGAFKYIQDDTNFREDAATKTAFDRFRLRYLVQLHFLNLTCLSDILFASIPNMRENDYTTSSIPEKCLENTTVRQISPKLEIEHNGTKNKVRINDINQTFTIKPSYREFYDEIKGLLTKSGTYYSTIPAQPSFKGGYSPNDTDVYTRILLSGLIDIDNMPYKSYDDIIGEKTYESAIEVSTRLLNAVRDYKIKAVINNDIVQLSTDDIKKPTIYNFLAGNKKCGKDEINEFNKLYQFSTLMISGASAPQAEARNYDFKIFKQLWDTVKNTPLIKQLRPLFLLFSSQNGAALNNPINMDKTAIKAAISDPDKKIKDVEVAKALMFSIKTLFASDDKHSKDIDINNNLVETPGQTSADYNIFKDGYKDKGATEDNADVTGIPRLLYRWQAMIKTIRGVDKTGNLLAVSKEKIEVAGLLAVLSGYVNDNVLTLCYNYPNIESELTELHIDEFKGMIAAYYIKARMNDLDNMFRSRRGVLNAPRITDVSYGTIMKRIEDAGGIVGEPVLKYDRGYETPKIDDVLLSQYILTKPLFQPVLNLSKYDFILRDTQSFFGKYSLLNPWYNIMSTSWHCLPKTRGKLQEEINKCGIIVSYNDENISFQSVGGSQDVSKYLWFENCAVRSVRASNIKIDQYYLINYSRKQINSGAVIHKSHLKPVEYIDGVADPDGLSSLTQPCGSAAGANKEINNKCRDGSDTDKVFSAFFLRDRYGSTKEERDYDTYMFNALLIPEHAAHDKKFNKGDKDETYTINQHTAFEDFRNTIWAENNSPTSIGMNIINDTLSGVTYQMETTVNTGFADNMFNKMTGGSIGKYMYSTSTLYANGNSFITNYINNPEEPFSAISPIETYTNIYKNIVQDSKHPTDNFKNVAMNAFKNMFKFNNVANMSVDYMFALIINYFHKYTVSFNSIYNQVLFPSIVYNGAVFKVATGRYSDIFGKDTEKTNAFTSFIRSYLNILENNVYMSGLQHYDEKDTTGERIKDTSYKSLHTLCKQFAAGNYEICSVKNMPSLNDKFLSLLFTSGLIGENDTDAKFRTSSLLNSIKHCDGVETFVFVILLINKYLSYYNIESETDVAYSGQIGQEPFGYRLDI